MRPSVRAGIMKYLTSADNEMVDLGLTLLQNQNPNRHELNETVLQLLRKGYTHHYYAIYKINSLDDTGTTNKDNTDATQ